MTVELLPKKSVFSTARKCVHYFGRFLEGQKPLLALGAGASLVLTAFELLRPWPIKVILDHVLIPRGKNPPAWFQTDDRETILLLASLAMVLIPFCLGLLNRISQVSLAQVGRKVTTRVRRMVCEHVQLLPLSYHHNSKTGDLLMRVMGDVNMVRDILFSGWVSLVQRVLVFLATFGLMLWISPWMALLALLPLPLLFWSVKRSGGEMKDAVSKQRKKEGSAAALASELFSQIRGIKAFGAERRSARIFGSLSRSGEKAGVKATRIASMASLQAECATGAGLAAMMLLGSHQVLGGEISAGSLILMLSYARALYKPLRKLSRDGIRLAKAAACADRLFEVLDLPPESSTGKRRAPVFRGNIRFEGVSFAYGDQPPALVDATFDVAPGSLCVLKGKNGSGKSTTLSLLLRLFKPGRGRILVDGEEAEQFDLDSWRERFACVPQDTLLFSGTLEENILFGRPDASPECVQEALRATGLGDVVDSLPDGLATDIGESGNKLSGGQQRLVSLARAAIRSSPILVLDEPLEGLDPKARLRVAKAIRAIANGRTTLVVSHTSVDDIEPDQVIEIRDGITVECVS